MSGRQRQPRFALAALLAGAALVAPASQAGADPMPWGRPAASALPLPWDASGLLSVDRAALLEPVTVAMRLDLEWRDRPLAGLVESQLEGRVGVHVGILRWLQAGVLLPVSWTRYLVDESALPADPGGEPRPWNTSVAAGDLRFYAKLRLAGTRAINLAAFAGALIPTGDTYGFRGDGLWAFEPRLVFDAKAGPITFVLDAGARLRGTSAIEDPAPSPVIALGPELTWGGAIVARLHRVISLAAEASGSEALPSFSHAGRTAAALGSIWITPAAGWSLYVGGGRSLDQEATRIDRFRIFAGLTFQPPTIAQAEREQDAKATTAADAESAPDGDLDGVPDARDRCPAQMEDLDGYQDEDGCPDPDNDADGILDANDRCPDEAEDKDGFDDDDGCPDPDNDGDNIPDARDRCPNEPETANGIDDDDGCPDSAAPAGSTSATPDAAPAEPIAPERPTRGRRR